jgi:hypothetical protein
VPSNLTLLWLSLREHLAARLTTARSRLGPLVDLLWPTVEPWPAALQAKEDAKQARSAQWDEAIADSSLFQTPEQAAVGVAKAKEILDVERTRGTNVETRMTGFLTLSSIGVAASLVGLAQQAYGSLGKSSALTISLASYSVIICTSYIFAQSVCLSLAALRGLERRGYFEPIASGLLPVRGDTAQTLARRQIRTYLACARDHTSRNSEKTDQMQVVHLTLRNIALGLVPLVIALSISFAMTAGSSVSPQPLPELLRTHPELVEMLRGPQGPQGATGPPGPASIQTVHECPGVSDRGNHPRGHSKSRDHRHRAQARSKILSAPE